jgi:hypothetical protein
MAFKPVDKVEHIAASQPAVHDAWSQFAADHYAPRVTRVASQGERASKMDAVLPLLPPIVPGGGDSEVGGDAAEHTLRLNGGLGNGGRQILPRRYD